jgi:hypothetical protein
MPWLDYVGIPYLALIAVAVLERGGGWDSLSRKVLELGIDACILGLGVTGSLFAGGLTKSRLGEDTAGLAVAAVLIELIVLGLCLNMRTWERWTERSRASASIFLGVTVLVADSEIVWRLVQ